MDNVKLLIGFWEKKKCLPEDLDFDAILPRGRNAIENELKRFLVCDRNEVEAVRLTLNTLLDAWTELWKLNEDHWISSTLLAEELLIIRHIVPLCLPRDLPFDLKKRLHRKQKRQDDTITRKWERCKTPLTIQDIIAMDDSTIPAKLRHFGKKNTGSKQPIAPVTIDGDDESAKSSESEDGESRQGRIRDDEHIPAQIVPKWSAKTKRLAEDLQVMKSTRIGNNTRDRARKGPVNKKMLRRTWTLSEEDELDRNKLSRFVSDVARDG